MIKGLGTEHYSVKQNELASNFVDLHWKEDDSYSTIPIEDLDEIVELIQSYKKYVLKETPKYPFMECTNKWMTKNGEELELASMTRKHLKNCKSMIESICHDEKLNATDYIIYNNIVEELNIKNMERFNRY